MRGFYGRRLCKSKWGAAREQQNWPLLVQAAPKLCKRFKELPNSLRGILHLPQKSNHPTEFGTASSLPQPLKIVIEGLIMDRIECGEEVSSVFVRNTLTYCVDLWNECVHAIRGMMQTKSLEMLKEHDESYSQMSQDQLDNVFNKMKENIDKVLVTIDISKSEGALRNSGSILVSC